MTLPPDDKNFWGPINLELRDTALQSMEEWEVATFGMLPWKHCQLIVKTMKYWLPEFAEASKNFSSFQFTPQLQTLWEYVLIFINFSLLIYITLRSFAVVWDLLGTTKEELEILDRKQAQKAFYTFGKLFITAYPNTKATYIHIVVCHTVEVSIFYLYSC